MPPGMTYQEVDTKAERRKRVLKISAISLGAAIVLIGGSGMAWYLTPPAMPETVEEARALVESPRYERLSKEAKQPYLDVIREQFGSLNREERRAMMQENEEMRQALRESRDAEREAFTKAYVLATPQEREAMLREMEVEREARRAERGGPPEGSRESRPEGEGRSEREGDGDRAQNGNGERGGSGDGERRRRGPSNERVNERATNGNAQNSQLRSEMRQERRKQREAQENRS